jgi:hypothetical protein
MSRVHISKAEIALWGSVSWQFFFSRHFNLNLRLPWFSIGRIEHIKKAQKTKSKVVKKSKKKVKDAAHKVVDAVTPNSWEEHRPVSWKKDILEGRQERKIEAEQKRQSENVYDQATEPATHDSENERNMKKTPRPDFGIATGRTIPEETIA